METAAIIAAIATLLEAAVKLAGDFPQVETAIAQAGKSLPGMIEDVKQLIAALRQDGPTAEQEAAMRDKLAAGEAAFDAAAQAVAP